MGANDKLGELFFELIGGQTAEARQLYYLAHPILATRKSIDVLAARVSAGDFRRQDDDARLALEEMREFVEVVDVELKSYPLGPGPVERIWTQIVQGKLREDHGLALAAAPESADVLSERYSHALGFNCAVQASSGRWEGAQQLHRLLLAAARACRNSDARAVRIRAEREWLVTATQVLMHVADGRVYKDAVAGGEWLLQTLEEGGEKELLGETLHYMGVLHLDPYGAFRKPENHELEHRMWLTRTAQELGPEVVEGIPTTREALGLAESYFRRAIEIATDEHLGYARKALMQVAAWKEALGEDVGPEQLENAAKTLATLDPMQDPGRWLRVAEKVLDLGGELDEDKVTAILSVSIDEWERRLGSQLTVGLLPPLLLLLGKRDPWKGLEVASQASRLVAETPNEDQRSDCYSCELGLFRRIAEHEGIGLPDAGEDAVSSVMAADSDPEVRAACLVGLALRTPASNDETKGLQLLDQADALAPQLTKRHRPALGYLRAVLWMGCGSNAAQAEPRRTSEALVGYGNSIHVGLEHRSLNHVLEMWKRVEDLCSELDALGAETTLRLLLGEALASELALGEPVAGVIQSICRRLTVAFAAGAGGLLPILWQVAKGQRWAATLGEKRIIAPARDERAQQILKSLAEARRTLPPGDAVEQPITSDSVLFEAWLTSYVRTERYDGDQAWERVANLKMTFDERIGQLLAPRDARPPTTVKGLDEIQASLGPKSVLLVAYVGEHSDGRAATYGALITREEVSIHGRVPDFEGNEFSVKQGERMAVLSAVAVQVSGIRRALLRDPDAGKPTTRQAADLLEEALPLLFGGLSEELAALQAAGKDHLIIAPANALHFAPIHLFTVQGKPLADHWTVSYLPNLALLGRARPANRKRKQRRASIGLGFAGGKGGWIPIEEAVEEAQQIAGVLGIEALLDEHATKPAVLAALADSTSVHIASHGALDVDAPALQMLVLHPPDTESSQLCAHEILDLDLSGLDLVTLSACETALGRVDRSDNLRGMPAALLTAGVSTLVGTLWPVESTASKTFFTTFYEALGSGRRRLDAFRAAQTKTRSLLPAYRDWGPFYLAGSWD